MKRKFIIKRGVSLLFFLTVLSSCSSNTDDNDKEGELVPDPPPIEDVDDDLTNIPKGFPVDFGFDETKFKAVNQKAERMGKLTGLLILRRDTLVFENYYNGFVKGEETNLKSSSKSILNLLIGIAIDKGYINNIDETLFDYMPELFQNESIEEEKRRITIRDLMTMTSGLESTSLDNYSEWTSSDDWVLYALERPLEADPGTLFSYSTGDTHLLSALLTKATGMSSLEFAQKYLFKPMGITVDRWDTGPQGINEGGNNLYMRQIDLAKIGIMVKNGGTYQGVSILSKDWITESISFQVMPHGISRPLEIEGYGYLWWLVKANEYSVYASMGHGGQYMLTIPEKDLIIILTSVYTGSNPSSHFNNLGKIVEDYILTALID